MKILQIGEGREFSLLEIPKPSPGPGEVLLYVEGVTTCPQWDLHLRHNEPMFVGHKFVYPYTPGQPGHEATGTVEAVGEGVTELKVGDRVSAWRDVGHGVPGCYAQYVVHRAENLIRVPAHLPAAATAPVELAMCVGATFLMLWEMQALSGRRIGIMGLGPAGLIAAQMARAEGATEVIGFDLAPQRREYGLTCGLNVAYDPREMDATLFPTRPAKPALDGIVDCVGAKASVEWAMDHAREWVALFGVQREDYVFAPRHYTLRLLGYPGHSRAAAEYAVDMLRDGQLDLSRLVTHHLPLERYAEGIDLLERQEAIKICFTPWKDEREG
jgi:threonine dehydrogenase-like Zn-dependent dehydrogenase